jgi:hypothetical protein
VIVAVPFFTPVTLPPATVAIVESDELHVAAAVTSFVLPFGNTALTCSEVLCPAATLTDVEDIRSDVGVAGDELPLQAASSGRTNRVRPDTRDNLRLMVICT